MSHKTCSPECALEWINQTKERTKLKVDRLDRVETKKALEKLKTRSDWLKDVQKVFNQFIKERDQTEPCISCGRHHTGQYHAGHYLSVGARPNLRFEENNVHKQCAPCNTYLSGNLINYRINLIKKIGLEEVEQLESDINPRKYTIDDLKNIIEVYRKRVKMLKTVD
jgi:hypothetical protein